MSKRLGPILATAALLAALTAAPASAQEGFGLTDLDVRFEAKDGSPAMDAGAHPYAVSFDLDANTEEAGGEVLPIGSVKDIEIEQPAGFAADRAAVPTCPSALFLLSIGDDEVDCPYEAALGKTKITVGEVGQGVFDATVPVYNLPAPPGAVIKLGFEVTGVPVTLEAGLSEDYPFDPVVEVTNVSQAVTFHASETTVWGDPASPEHDAERGICVETPQADLCSLQDTAERAFITAPRSCTGALETVFRARSWQQPGSWVTEPTVLTHDDSEPPKPLGLQGCEALGFSPKKVEAAPTSALADSASGLEFELEIDDLGLLSPSGRAESDMKRVELALPEGMTANPGMAAGLGTCSQAAFERESLDSPPGHGCPQSSKIGTVEAESPLLAGTVLHGQLFVAEPHKNPYGTLLALYMVLRDPGSGVFVALPGRVDPDPATGRLTTTFGAEPFPIPQFPVSAIRVRLREGARSPLVTPPGCGAHEIETRIAPWADPSDPFERASAFEIEAGPGGGPCPSGLPFSPGFEAGTANNAAGAYSPFAMRLTRADAEQDMTRFSAVLPPGVAGRIAGVPWCPDAAIAAAAGRDGKDELASPSCPAASRLGGVLAAAGVGEGLTWAQGSLYLAPPYKGAPLSVAAIVPAVAGPFDVGTVVTRVGLRLNPKTGQVEVDGAASDPIPHILAGIPLRVRDIRVLADRPDFTLNPTSCEPSATLATIWGGGQDFLSAADDVPVGVAARFQAAGCASLAFKPRLAIKLFGGVKRGAFPALRAIVTPPPGQANFQRAVVTLPRSAFLEQGHIRTICTRVQFAAGSGHGSQCPKGAVYGQARAWSPLLDAPASGPVYLRSSDNKLPDLVVALKGPDSAAVDVELSARIDSVKGGIRSIFTAVPDLPVSRFILAMQGGQKGLIVNSRNLCHKPARNRARANLIGQNGRRALLRPVTRAVKCAKKRRKAKRARVSHRRLTGGPARR